MLLIKLKDADKLYELLFEIQILTYLQSLAYSDTDRESIYKDLDREGARAYLLEKQLDTVIKLKNLTECDDFLLPLSDTNTQQNF